MRDRAAFLWALLLPLAALAEPRPDEEVLAVKPLVILSRNFASPRECANVLELLERCHGGGWSDCHELRSRLHNAESNRSKNSSLMQNRKRPWRNSTSFTLDLPGELEPTLDALVRRAHLLARHPVTYGEGVQVASYQAGDYYEFHHDSLMRRATVLLYLTDVAEGEGGETIFPLVRAPGVPEDAEPPLPPAVTRKEKQRFSDFKVDHMEDMAPYCESDFYLKVRPVAGTAILFFSYRPDYSMDEFSIHGACPLRSGRKAIFQRWMRFEENSLFGKAEEAVKKARSLWGHERLLPVATVTTTSTSSSTEKMALEEVAGPASLRSAGGQLPPEL